MNMKRRTTSFHLLAAIVAMVWSPFARGQNDLAMYTDEFYDSATLSDWSRVHVTEGWNADQLETLAIDTVTPGTMVIMPYTCSWYEDYRGPLVYKEITGDFVVTAQVHTTGRDGFSVPQSQYSLAGLMVRTPRSITPGTWTADGENYVFFSIGHGNNGGTSHQFEVKTTVAGTSTLVLSNSSANTALLQIARLGDYVIVLLQEPSQPWVVHARYNRSDFPATVQVGAVSYTDWEKVNIFTPFDQNNNVLDPPLSIPDPNPGIPFNPDIIATYDYIRFYRPTLPFALVGVDLTNTGLVSDAQLLAFLGSAANAPVFPPGVPSSSPHALYLLLWLLLFAGAAAAIRRRIAVRR